MLTLVEEFKRTWLTSIIGLFCFIGSVWMLTWNEGRAVRHAHSLSETYNNAISLNPFDKVQPEFDGRVVHMSNNLLVDEPLTEPDYGISVQAVKLKRRVQMYQWIEERSSRDDEDTSPGGFNSVNDYFYVTEWRDKLIDSSSYYIRHGHENPKEIPLKTVTYMAPSVRVGHLMIGNEIKEKFDDFVEVTSDERPERRDIKLHMGLYYHCVDVWNPEVGDIRVQFYYAGSSGEPVTIIAKQEKGVLVPYKTSKGHEIALLRHGHFGISEMFSAEHFDAKLETWKLRGVGIFMMYASCVCLAGLFKIIFLQSPILADVISGSSGSFGNLILAISVSLIVIATTWLLYRPMIAAGLLIAAISPFLYCTIGVYNAAHTAHIN